MGAYSTVLQMQVRVVHAGIDAEGLDPNLDCHHLIVNDWQDLEASQNVCIISIPSVFDASLAPAGKHTIHAYVAANEPYDIWEGLDKKSQEYKDLKVPPATQHLPPPSPPPPALLLAPSKRQVQCPHV